jgi:hypothetical protein
MMAFTLGTHHSPRGQIAPELGRELERSVAKAARYYATMGYGSFAAGNPAGGLTAISPVIKACANPDTCPRGNVTMRPWSAAGASGKA